MLPTQRHNKLLIRVLLARLVQHAHMRLTPIQRFARLAQPARQAVVDQRQLQYTLERFQRRHLRGRPTALGICGYGYLLIVGTGVGVTLGGGGGVGLFSVRLRKWCQLCYLRRTLGCTGEKGRCGWKTRYGFIHVCAVEAMSSIPFVTLSRLVHLSLYSCRCFLCSFKLFLPIFTKGLENERVNRPRYVP